jgi:hypothetical protein
LVFQFALDSRRVRRLFPFPPAYHLLTRFSAKLASQSIVTRFHLVVVVVVVPLFTGVQINFLSLRREKKRGEIFLWPNGDD